MIALGSLAKSLRSPAHTLLIAKLKAARIRAGLSQQALANLIQHPQSYIAKIETGERRVDVIEFLRIAHVLHCDPFDVLEDVHALVRQNAQ